MFETTCDPSGAAAPAPTTVAFPDNACACCGGPILGGLTATGLFDISAAVPSVPEIGLNTGAIAATCCALCTAKKLAADAAGRRRLHARTMKRLIDWARKLRQDYGETC